MDMLEYSLFLAEPLKRNFAFFVASKRTQGIFQSPFSKGGYRGISTQAFTNRFDNCFTVFKNLSVSES
jgi:hypothetical protein